MLTMAHMVSDINVINPRRACTARVTVVIRKDS